MSSRSPLESVSATNSNNLKFSTKLIRYSPVDWEGRPNGFEIYLGWLVLKEQSLFRPGILSWPLFSSSDLDLNTVGFTINNNFSSEWNFINKIYSFVSGSFKFTGWGPVCLSTTHAIVDEKKLTDGYYDFHKSLDPTGPISLTSHKYLLGTLSLKVSPN